MRISICRGNVRGTSAFDALHVVSPGLGVLNPMLCLESRLVAIVDLLQMLLDARIDFLPTLGFHDPRLPRHRDLAPRRVVHRQLPNELPEVVSPMSRTVTERHQGLSIVPLKPDQDGAM
ncbi:hypothetical protein Tco_0345059 [Tanacetum coccineum]